MNCLVVDDDAVQRKLISKYVNDTQFLTLVKDCSDLIDTANVLAKEQIDLLFLDIELPTMTGLDFIRTLKIKPLIILVTAHKEFAVESYEEDVTDYLVKPVEYARFLKAVNKAAERFEANKQVKFSDHVLFVKEGTGLVKINTNDILFVQSEGDYTAIITPERKYMILATLHSIEAKLPNDKFIRVHRSYIVHTDKINRISQDSIEIGDKNVPISKSYKEQFMRKLNKL